MRATFQLDGCHDLSITEDAPRVAGDPRSVSVQIMRTGFSNLPDGIVASSPESVASINLKPSHARAIASALLAAATEAAH